LNVASLDASHTEEPPVPVVLSPDDVRALREAISLGYLRGILNRLERLVQAQPQAKAWAAQVASLARRYEFESINALLLEPHVKVSS
jgi:hypothetical protein